MFQPAPRLRRCLVTLGLCATLLATGAIAPRPASAAVATPSAAQARYIALHVLALFNAERALHRLGPLRMDGHLVSSAHAHNLAMARYNSMSHQVPGEASLGPRISHTGYTFSSAGENIAWNSDWSLRGAYYLQRLMWSEAAPNDAHKRNILNPAYRDVGVDIVMDPAHHRMWLTEDLGRAR